MDLAELNLKVNSSSVKRATRDLNRLSKSAGGATGSFNVLRRALIAATTAMAAFGAAAVKQFAKIEKTQITLQTLIGNVEQTDEVMRQLRNISATTPLDFDALAEGTALLKAFGTETKDLIPDLLRLSDAALALGGNRPAESLQRFIRTLGEIRSQGRLDNEDLRRLAELKIPNLLPDLASMFGVESTREFRKAVEDWRVDSEDAIHAVFDILERRTGGIAEAVGHTTAGAFDIFVNNAKLQLEQIGIALDDAFDFAGVLQKMVPAMREYGNVIVQTIKLLRGQRAEIEKLDPRARELADAFESFIVAVKVLIALQLALWLKGVAAGLVAVAVASAANPLGALLVAVIAVTPALKELGDELNRLAVLQRELSQVKVFTPAENINQAAVISAREARREFEALRDVLGDPVGLEGLTTLGQNVADAISALQAVRVLRTEGDNLISGKTSSQAHGVEMAEKELRLRQDELKFLLDMARDLHKVDAETNLRNRAPKSFPLRPPGGNAARLIRAREKRIRDAKSEIDDLLEMRREFEHDLTTIGMSDTDTRLADAQFALKERLRTQQGGLTNVLANMKAFIAETALIRAVATQDEIDEEVRKQKRLAELREAARANLRETMDDLRFEIDTIGLSNEGRERAIFLREAETEAIKAFGAGTQEAADAVAELAEEFDNLMELQKFEQVFDDLEAGIRNAVTAGLEAAIFDEDWQAALAAAFRRIAATALDSAVNNIFDGLLGKTGDGNQQSLFGVLGGLFGGGGGGDGPKPTGDTFVPVDIGGGASKRAFDVTVFNVPDQATADSMAAKMSSRGSNAVVARGNGNPGVTSGRVPAGARR